MLVGLTPRPAWNRHQAGPANACARDFPASCGRGALIDGGARRRAYNFVNRTVPLNHRGGITLSPVEKKLRLRNRVLHGHRVAYRQAGRGPVVVLVHGITSDSSTWERVMPALARRFTVLAPDLMGHGQSDKPRSDYSLGAQASGLRDLLATLGHERATFVGHSLGGGISMQLSYMYPELCERLVLVDSGGLGRDVSLLLRAAALPGSEWVMPALAATHVLDAGRIAAGILGRVGIRVGTDLEEMAAAQDTLADPGARAAFLQTLRGVVEPGGQRVNASNRLYLAKHTPTLLVWGERDRIIPVAHGHDAHAQIAHSRLEIFPRAGHFPHLDDPERFVEVLSEFVESTEPADVDAEGWRELLKAG